MDAITFLDVIEASFYGSIGLIIIGCFMVIVAEKRIEWINGWIETVVAATSIAVVSTGAWIYHGLTGDESLELVIVLFVIAMILMFLTVPIRIWWQKKMENRKKKND